MEIETLADLSSSRRNGNATNPEPLAAVVLPPHEGFGPGRSGAIGLIARRLVATPGFRTVVLGGEQGGPLFTEAPFQPVRPGLWPGSANVRFAVSAIRALRRLAPALIEVHNRPEIALRLARHLNPPVTLMLNNDPLEMRAARSVAERSTLLRHLALVTTSSDYLRERFLDGLEGSDDRVAVLHNCIDLAAFPPPRQREDLILFAGRVVADKGTDAFIAACAEALPRLPGWRAEIIGADRFRADSPDTDFVRKMQQAARAAGVVMTGYRDHPFVVDANARAAIAVVPSRWPEPFGLTALEALAAGAALITSGRGGLGEVAGDAAVYVDPDRPGELASAILALAQDPARREALGAAGRERARQFDLPIVGARLVQLRRSVMH